MNSRDNHIVAVGLASLEVEDLQEQIFQIQEKARTEISVVVSRAVGTNPGSVDGQAAKSAMDGVVQHLAEAVNQCELTKQFLSKYSNRKL